MKPYLLGLLASSVMFAASGANAAVEAEQGAAAPAASAPSSADDYSIQEIVVTAQKRKQSANDVGISITSVNGDALQQRGVTTAYDLSKVVPGLAVANVGNGATIVYTLRGIGFNSSNLGATPTVSVYVDEVPLPYPVMTQGVALDLSRVEVLKGPQGTLFGQNSTAGAINYIAAKPTDEFSAGVSGTYGRFNFWNVNGYVSGPIGDNLKIRLAASHDGGGAWQKSYTRDDHLGKNRRTLFRGLVYWDPSEALSFKFSFNGWHDGSDSQALQLVRYVPLEAPGLPGPAAYPVAPRNDRAADWNVGTTPRFDSTFLQPSLRADWKLTDDVTLTSISTYSYFKTDSFLDDDGTTFEMGEIQQFGHISDFNQELRLSGRVGPATLTVGGTYQNNHITEDLNIFSFHESNVQNIAGSGFSGILAPVVTSQDTDAKAIFGNVDYKFSNKFSVVAGIRYTDTKIDFRGCNLDAGPPIPNTPIPGVTSSYAGFFNILYQTLTGSTNSPVQQGGCITLDNISRNGQAPTYLPTDSPNTLKENNVSWSVIANYKLNPSSLLYARVAQGYKSGNFPTQGSSVASQFLPAKQEGLLSYEAGFKTTLLDRKLHIEGALFYYAYKNKQLQNFVPDPVFGPLVTVVNIPKSNVKGAEASIVLTPVRGLTISAAGTYVKSRITRFIGFDEKGVVKDFHGVAFNFSPKWTATSQIDYEHSLSSGLTGFVGAGLTFHSKTTGIIGSGDPGYDIDGYTLLDLQLGVRSANGWSAQIFGRNVTNKYYWNNVNHITDTIVRAAGMPATYGITVGYKF